MMPLHRTLAIAALAIVAAGCDDKGDAVTNTPAPSAGIRYVNAVPDTLPLDFHAVDIVENSPYIATNFREIKQASYTRAATGSRHFRVFPNSTNITVTSVPLADLALDLQANVTYSIYHVGFARAGQSPAQHLVVRTDTAPTVPAGQVAVRVVHLGTGIGPVNVFTRTDADTTLPATPAFAAVDYLGVTPYQYFPIAAIRAFRARAVAGGAQLAAVTIPVGDPGSSSLDPVPGSNIAGSVFTIYIFPRSVAGSTAPQTAAFTTPALGYAQDVLLHRP